MLFINMLKRSHSWGGFLVLSIIMHNEKKNIKFTLCEKTPIVLSV